MTNPAGSAPQISLLTGGRYGRLPDCVACGQPVETNDEYYLCWTGTSARPCVLAAAHPGRWADDDEYNDACADALRALWHHALAEIGAGLLHLGVDGGGRRFYLGDTPLHAGTAIDVLTTNGDWLGGRFEYRTSPTWSPRFYLALGGWDAPRVHFELPDDAVIRLAPEPHDR